MNLFKDSIFLAILSSVNHQKYQKIDMNGEVNKAILLSEFFSGGDTPAAELGFSIRGGETEKVPVQGMDYKGRSKPMTWREVIGSISERSQLTVHLSYGVDRSYLINLPETVTQQPLRIKILLMK